MPTTIKTPPKHRHHQFPLIISVVLLLECGVFVSPFSHHGGLRLPSSPCRTMTGTSHERPEHSPLWYQHQYQHYTHRNLHLLQYSNNHNHGHGRRAASAATSTSLSMGIRSFIGGRLGRGGNNDDDREESPEDIKAALEAIKADLEAVAQKEKEDNKLKSKKVQGVGKTNPTTNKAPIRKQVPSMSTSSPTSTASTSASSGVASMYNQFSSPGATPSSSSTSPTSTTTRTGTSATSPSSTPTSKTSRVAKAIHKITNSNPSSSSPSPYSLSSSSPSITPSSRYGETVRDRVKRVKSGAMTEDEKLAFLNNALTPRSAPGKKGPRIRQAIPDPADKSSSSKRRNNSNNNSKNSPFRNDALWNKVLGNANSNDRNKRGNRSPYNIDDVVGSDSAKRQYLDMVTDPNRFASYAAMNAPKEKAQEQQPIGVGDGGVIDNLKSLQGNDASKEEDDPDSLANRLQSAAIMKEKQDAEIKAQRDLERQAEKDRIAEAQRQAAEEIRRRQEETIQQAKEEQEKLIREDQERVESEQNRQKAILDAQEAYWANQLKKNGGGVGAGPMSNEQKEKNLEQITKTIQGYDNQAAIEKARAQQVDESDILIQAKEDDLHERERNANILENSVAQATNTVPQPVLNDVSPDSFVQEQERKKAELDRLVEEQKARLATLNSPLPTPPEGPFSPPPIANSSPVFPPPSLIPKIPTSVPSPAVPPPSRAPMPGLSLSDLTMNNKKKPNGTSASSSVTPPPPPPPSDPAPRLSLRDMTMLNNAKTTTTTTTATSSTARNANTAARTPPPPPPPRKGPIRQNVPVVDSGEEDDVDFFEYSRNGDNRNMSIKDIMASNGDSSSDDASSAAKQKSKMWGIDIDKFDL